MAKNFGRHRQSIADIEQELDDIFRDHPQFYTNAAGVTSLPARCLSDVFDTYRKEYGVELLTQDEMASFMQIVDASPGVEATPDIILQLVAMRTSSGQQNNSDDHSPNAEEWNRGRADERDFHSGHSRSSSHSSTGTFYRSTPGSRPPSRPPSRGDGGMPHTPGMKDSPFDAQKRQRSTPLTPVAPSSWTRRPAAPGRRKSDASNYGRAMSDSELARPASSPPLGAVASRPHSRSQSKSTSPFSQFSPPQLDIASAMYEAFEETVTRLPMPRLSSDSDSEDSEDDSGLGRVFDRSTASSTASMEASERLEALQRVNVDLGKKLAEAERTLQRKLADHEVELEEMEARLEEARSELSAAKREEKELRNKERLNQTQITALESEIAKVQKTLDSSRTMYNSLQKQYQEQLNESEDLRNMLRRKDEDIRTFRESLSLQQMETAKYLKENEAYEERIVLLEQDLAFAQQAQASLDEQKQENLMLKETIDRMRFDMDDCWNGMSSAPGSVSRSLGAELLSKMRNGGWLDDEDEADSAATLKELGIDNTDENSEDEEDIVQTIITRKKKRGLSKANDKIESSTLEDSREYVDAYTQYDSFPFIRTSSSQTDPAPTILTASSALRRTHLHISRSPSPQEDDETLASSSSTVLPPTPKAKPSEDLSFSHISDPQKRRDLRVAVETLQSWHGGLKVPLRPRTGVSAELLEEWRALKSEVGIGCGVFDRVLEDAAAPSVPTNRRRKSSRFYNIYNTYVYGGEGVAGRVPWGGLVSHALLCAGASAVVFFAMSPLLAHHYVVPGGPTYYDRAAWSSFNSMHPSGEGFSGENTAAVWNFLGRLGGGAARIARGWPT
ncbi:hypothetical protein B0F90DRAFT_1810993 [Multifurca ochricompacta]|uniref:Uncharacterized protein n=1 Tax=Multifurca ochricompacta TaxID=376703 RepID=A0AAD4M1Q2_9AGAM|nr:hypothetical protein B0F90DRAFT_1810993 [Multifurca ochricompacta]